MSKISGEEKIKDKSYAISFFSDYKNLLNCTPGVREIKDNEFIASVKVGPFGVEVQGKVKEHRINGDTVHNVIEVTGPGITVTINTSVKVEDSKIAWTAEYEISGSLANVLQKTISKEAEEITRKIILCTISKINGSYNT